LGRSGLSPGRGPECAMIGRPVIWQRWNGRLFGDNRSEIRAVIDRRMSLPGVSCVGRIDAIATLCTR
jgi:hypothetical protein